MYHVEFNKLLNTAIFLLVEWHYKNGDGLPCLIKFIVGFPMPKNVLSNKITGSFKGSITTWNNSQLISCTRIKNEPLILTQWSLPAKLRRFQLLLCKLRFFCGWRLAKNTIYFVLKFLFFFLIFCISFLKFAKTNVIIKIYLCLVFW